jgi:DNA-binding transcriptional LysR family regulator
MELRHLRYFVAVAEETGVGRAARRLNVAQPALSRQIQDLERELGVVLFERLPRGLALTDPGQAFLTEARAMLEHAARAAQAARRVALGESGRVVVGYVEAANTSGVLPTAVRLHSERHPGVSVELRRLTSAQQWSAIRSREIDVGFVHARPHPVGGLAFAPVFDEPCTGVLLPAMHRVARRSELSIVDLSAEPMLLFPRAANPPLYDRVLGALRVLGVDAVVAQELPDVSGVLAFVALSAGWHVVPASSCRVLPPGIVFRPVQGLAIPFGIELMWRDEHSPVVRAFSESVLAVGTQASAAGGVDRESDAAGSDRREYAARRDPLSNWSSPRLLDR